MNELTILAVSLVLTVMGATSFILGIPPVALFALVTVTGALGVIAVLGLEIIEWMERRRERAGAALSEEKSE